MQLAMRCLSPESSISLHRASCKRFGLHGTDLPLAHWARPCLSASQGIAVEGAAKCSSHSCIIAALLHIELCDGL